MYREPFHLGKDFQDRFRNLVYDELDKSEVIYVKSFGRLHCPMDKMFMPSYEDENMKTLHTKFEECAKFTMSKMVEEMEKSNFEEPCIIFFDFAMDIVIIERYQGATLSPTLDHYGRGSRNELLIETNWMVLDKSDTQISPIMNDFNKHQYGKGNIRFNC